MTKSFKYVWFFVYLYIKNNNFVDVHKTAIVITDGESILDKVDEPARRLREQNTEVYSIGVAAAIPSVF